MIAGMGQEDSVFSDKSALDTFGASRIIGRDEKAVELVRVLLGYRKGLAVPFVSVYGRSGCGKSSVVRFVCDNIDDVKCCFVNLRKAKTVFGCANLVLAELGEPNVKNAQGVGIATDRIGDAVAKSLEASGKKLFVLVLDELDALFLDKRGRPSDFVYNLVTLEEKLRKTGRMMCIVGISNNVMTEFDLDDRVRSRIGTSEIFFEAYTKKDVHGILKDRARRAFSENVDSAVLEYCAEMSSSEHGDARRAVDLLRTAAEIAGRKAERLSKTHVDLASKQMQKDRVGLIVSTSSYHFRAAVMALARLTFLSGDSWHSTSSVYKQYRMILRKEAKPLTYRRVSELLVELQNTGIAMSQTASSGRHGYGTQYRLAVSPESIGMAVDPNWWESLIARKAEFEAGNSLHGLLGNFGRKNYGLAALQKRNKEMRRDNWRKFSGLD